MDSLYLILLALFPSCDYPMDHAAKETGSSQAYFESKKAEQGEQ